MISIFTADIFEPDVEFSHEPAEPLTRARQGETRTLSRAVIAVATALTLNICTVAEVPAQATTPHIQREYVEGLDVQRLSPTFERNAGIAEELFRFEPMSAEEASFEDPDYGF